MRIILCDDDTAFTQVFEKRLLTVFKKYGITPEIVSAHTGVEALREITRRPTDVLFLDIDMPEKRRLFGRGRAVSHAVEASYHFPVRHGRSGVSVVCVSAVLVSPQNASGGAAAGNRKKCCSFSTAVRFTTRLR